MIVAVCLFLNGVRLSITKRASRTLAEKVDHERNFIGFFILNVSQSNPEAMVSTSISRVE